MDLHHQDQKKKKKKKEKRNGSKINLQTKAK
jgi:hypothetical protein